MREFSNVRPVHRGVTLRLLLPVVVLRLVKVSALLIIMEGRFQGFVHVLQRLTENQIDNALRFVSVEIVVFRLS